MRSVPNSVFQALATASIFSVAIAFSAFSQDQAKIPTGELPEGNGKAEIQRICTDCHDLAPIERERRTPLAWSQVISDMKARGAVGSPTDFDAISDYLNKNLSVSVDPGTTKENPTTPKHISPQ